MKLKLEFSTINLKKASQSRSLRYEKLLTLGVVVEALAADYEKEKFKSVLYRLQDPVSPARQELHISRKEYHVSRQSFSASSDPVVHVTRHILKG